MTLYLRRGAFAVMALAFGLVSNFAAAAPEKDNPFEIWVNDKWDYAAEGYDVTSYFKADEEGNLSATDTGPIKGDPQFSAKVANGTYIFASQENLDKFLAAPDTYRPTYGGHCAYALGKHGFFVNGDPEAWHVAEDGKLYFNLRSSIQKKWFKKKQEYIANADPRWIEKFPTSSLPEGSALAATETEAPATPEAPTVLDGTTEPETLVDSAMEEVKTALDSAELPSAVELPAVDVPAVDVPSVEIPSVAGPKVSAPVAPEAPLAPPSGH